MKKKGKIGIPRNVLALKVANFVARDILSVSFCLFYLFEKMEKNYISLVLFCVDDGIGVKRTEKNRKKLQWNFCNFQFCVFPHFIQNS